MTIGFNFLNVALLSTEIILQTDCHSLSQSISHSHSHSLVLWLVSILFAVLLSSALFYIWYRFDITSIPLVFIGAVRCILYYPILSHTNIYCILQVSIIAYNPLELVFDCRTTPY